MKSPLVAGLLWFFLGLAGGHRFYLRMNNAWWMLVLLVVVFFSYGVFKLITGGVLLLWWLADGVMLLEWVRRYNVEYNSKADDEPTT